MKNISLENLERNISFSHIYGLLQTWSINKRWSCIDEPRSQHGFLYIFCDGVTITLKNTPTPLCFTRGDLIYLPKNSEYTIEFTCTNNDHSNVLINFEILDTHGNEYALCETVCRITSDLSTKITDAMLTVVNLSKNLTHPTIPVTRAFYEFLEKLSNHLLATKLHTREKDSVLPAIYYLDSHILDDISIPQLAQMCLLNESAFRKAFKDYTGMNPVQYKTHVKISKAKLMLRSATEIPIESIAECLGFYDNAYFHKVFVKATGKTPKQYRDSDH